MTLVGLGKLRSVNAQVLLPIGDGAFFNGDPEFGFSKRENGETYQMLPLDRERRIALATGGGGGILKVPRNVSITAIENSEPSRLSALQGIDEANQKARAGAKEIPLPGARVFVFLRGKSEGTSFVEYKENLFNQTIKLRVSVKPEVQELIHMGSLMAGSAASTRDEKSMRILLGEVAEMYLHMANIRMNIGKHFVGLTDALLTNPILVSELVPAVNQPLFDDVKATFPGEAYTGSIFVCGVWSMQSIERGIRIPGIASNEGDKNFACLVSDRALEFVVAHEIGHLHGLDHVDRVGNIMHRDANDKNLFFNDDQIDQINPLGLDPI